MCMALKSVEHKSNEIPAVQPLIDMLDLAGAVVTADAMHCQRETANKIIAKQADFVLMVKANQASLQGELQQAILQAFEEENPGRRHCKTAEKSRNRRETREVTTLPVPKDAEVFARWPGVKTIGSIYRTREINGKFEESQELFNTDWHSTFCNETLPLMRAFAANANFVAGTRTGQHIIYGDGLSRPGQPAGADSRAVSRRLRARLLESSSWAGRVADGTELDASSSAAKFLMRCPPQRRPIVGVNIDC